MRKALYIVLILLVTVITLADDRIIQIVTSSGQHISVRADSVASINYRYHNQDSIDQAYRDSVHEAFVRDSLYQDSLRREAIRFDSIGRCHTVGFMIDSTAEYTIFTAALKMTGLYDSLNVVHIKQFERPADTRDTNGNELYCPTESRNGFTVFAEPDSVLHANGINSIADLVAYANRVYGDAADWYDYLRNQGLSVSTGTDYTSATNALNMLMAYHILPAAIPVDQLVYERNSQWRQARTWNYVNGGQPYDYYATLLPQTMMKIWQPAPLTSSRNLYINRYLTNNTLTDEVGTMGSENMHEMVDAGVRIMRPESDAYQNMNVHAYNGYIHGIHAMLVYDAKVPKGVLHERMRFNFASQLAEMANNRHRFLTQSSLGALSPSGYGSRIAFPNDYFENIRIYNNSTRLRYNVKGAYNAYMSDCMQGWGYYDLAVRMPALPDGQYEMRITYTPMSHGGTMEYSLGKNPDDTASFTKICDVDLTVQLNDPAIGVTEFTEEEDLGIASDKALRQRGYMRGSYSYTDHPEYADGSNNMRSIRRNPSIRKILGRFDIKQNEDYWLRLRTLTNDYDLKFWLLDYIEFVPVDVVDNTLYMEDWY